MKVAHFFELTCTIKLIYLHLWCRKSDKKSNLKFKKMQREVYYVLFRDALRRLAAAKRTMVEATRAVSDVGILLEELIESYAKALMKESGESFIKNGDGVLVKCTLCLWDTVKDICTCYDESGVMVKVNKGRLCNGEGESYLEIARRELVDAGVCVSAGKGG